MKDEIKKVSDMFDEFMWKLFHEEEFGDSYKWNQLTGTEQREAWEDFLSYTELKDDEKYHQENGGFVWFYDVDSDDRENSESDDEGDEDITILSETSKTQEICFELNSAKMSKTEIQKKALFMGQAMEVFITDTVMTGPFELEHSETVATIVFGGLQMLRLQFTTYWYRYNQEVETICNIEKRKPMQWSMDILKKLLKGSCIDWEHPDMVLLGKELAFKLE